MIKVGFIACPLTNANSVRGVGFYTKRLLEHMKPMARDFDIEILEIENCPPVGRFKIIHYPYFDLFYHTLPIFNKAKTVVTIHDIIPLEFPEHYPPGLRGRFNLQLQKLALNNVERIITDSYASIKSIHKYLEVPHEKLKLIYLAADEKFKKLKYPKSHFKLPKKFVLYVGDVNHSKNIPNLVLACQKINIPLVIVGKQAKEIENMDLSHPELSHLKNVDWSNVIRLGFVTDAELVNIYNLATVYCQPSFAEGFGLPVLEALVCGTPVACSNTYSLPEIAGDYATYFDPNNINSMINAIEKSQISNIQYPISNFSWDKTARETLMVYQEVLNEH